MTLRINPWYPLLALADLAFTLFAVVCCNWWAAWFASRDGWLPHWLAWLQTFDAPLDAGWRDGYKGYRAPTGAWSRWWQRTMWLYRNTGYGFGYWPLGTSFDPARWVVLHDEMSAERDLFIAQGPDGTFNLSYYGRWGTLKLGWKAKNGYARGVGWIPHWQWGPERRIPLTFSYSPFRRMNV